MFLLVNFFKKSYFLKNRIEKYNTDLVTKRGSFGRWGVLLNPENVYFCSY